MPLAPAFGADLSVQYVLQGYCTIKRPMRSLSVILYFLLFRCVNKGAKFLTAWIILSAGFFQLLKVTAYFKQEFVFLRGSAVVGLRSMVQYVSFIPVDE